MNMSEAKPTNDLDWDNLASPIPMNLLDSDFADASDEIPAQVVETAEAIAHITPTEPEEIVEAPKLDMHSQLKAQMEVDALADQEAQAKADEEEAAQRERLAQWMSNARARLQVADEEPQVPGAPPRARRDPSPTLIRRTEMQKTLGDAEEAEAMLGLESSSGYKTGKISLDGSDPMATIIVPKETFVASENSRTQKLKALERKVSKIKQMEAGAETMIMAARTVAPEKTNTRIAILVLGGLVPLILALGLFALARTGYLENLGDIFPSLFSHPIAKTSATTGSPTVSPHVTPKITTSVPTETESSTTELTTTEPTSTEPTLVAKVAPTPVAPKKMVQPVKVVVTPKANPIAVKPISSSPKKLSALEMASQALAKTRKNSEVSMAGISSQAAPIKSIQSEPANIPPVPTAEAEEASDQPATHKLVAEVTLPSTKKAAGQVTNPSSASSGKGEAILKASAQAALNRDRESLQSIYDRYAMGTPGLEGGLVVGLTVDPTGHILNGVISASSTGTPGFDQELLNKVMDWKLEAFPDVQARYISIPIHFEPKPQ